MSKLRVITLVPLLLVAIAVGCSSSNQGAIDKAVNATIAAAQPPTGVATATTEAAKEHGGSSNERVDIDAKDLEGWKLYRAAYENRVDIAQALIARGDDIDAKDNEFGMTPLHGAAWYDSLDVASLLIDRGADIDAKDNDGSTPLHGAAAENSRDVASLLIDRGADIEVKGSGGATPLHVAAWHDSLDVASLLIDRGANTDGIDLSWMN
jgi:ankyrin repeat protein